MPLEELVRYASTFNFCQFMNNKPRLMKVFFNHLLFIDPRFLLPGVPLRRMKTKRLMSWKALISKRSRGALNGSLTPT